MNIECLNEFLECSGKFSDERLFIQKLTLTLRSHVDMFLCKLFRIDHGLKVFEF